MVIADIGLHFAVIWHPYDPIWSRYDRSDHFAFIQNVLLTLTDNIFFTIAIIKGRIINSNRTNYKCPKNRNRVSEK